MKKILFALIAVFSMFQVAWAGYSKDNLVVQTKDGAADNYALTSRPVMKFNGTEMILKSGGTEFKYDLSNVQQLVYVGGQEEKKGDVNGDGTVDVSDANIVINIILGSDEAAKYNGRADVNGDGAVDVADVNDIITIMLNN